MMSRRFPIGVETIKSAGSSGCAAPEPELLLTLSRLLSVAADAKMELGSDVISATFALKRARAKPVFLHTADLIRLCDSANGTAAAD